MEKDDVWIYTTCEQCRGQCGIMAHRVDGVVVDLKGDPDFPNSRGKICAKGYAGIQNLYDPNRVTRPLKRTNPEKGLGIDPKWAPISWDEAMDLLTEKLSRIRKEDPRKLAFACFDSYGMHTVLSSWARAFGTPNAHWSGFYCGNYLHSTTYLTNGTFHIDFDVDHINYLILFGNQAGFMAGGMNPNLMSQKMAAARKRGLKVIVVDPMCNHAASKADEWVPIRPGTDGAMVLAMINVLLNDLGVCDREFLKRYTNGSYLVTRDGYYLRQDGKPLVWDVVEGKTRAYDAGIADCALEGSFVVDGVECKPAFQLLKDHVRKYTPEMASEITTVPAATIRRLAEEFGQEARIGSTIVLDGIEFPYRPAAVNTYRGAGAHKHGVATATGIMLLNMIVGNFYVPGGHLGQNIVGPSQEWGPNQFDGLVVPPDKEEVGRHVNFYKNEVKPPQSLDLADLFPMSSTRAPMNLATSLDPEKYKLSYQPELFMCARVNLFMGGCDYEFTEKVLKKYKFIVTFSTHLDEMAEMADLVLPESTFLEKLEVLPHRLTWEHTGQSGYWYWGIRQPVVPPAGEARDWCNDVLLELADRVGFLGDLYKIWNDRWELKEAYRYDPSQRYTWEEISDRRLKSQFGEEKGLAWFKEHGCFKFKREVDDLYPLPWLKVRFPLYNEVYKIAGQKVKEVTQAIGLMDWDVSDYNVLPDWKPCDAFASLGTGGLVASNFRVPTHSTSITAENPWLCEAAELNPYAQMILINSQTARSRGIKDMDRICVESAVGKVTGYARVTECIHPEVIGMSSHFGTLAKGKPVAYGKGVNFNRLVPYDTDPVSAGVDACVKVKVYKE